MRGKLLESWPGAVYVPAAKTAFVCAVQKRLPDEARAELDAIDLCLLFIHPPAHGSEVSPAARNTLDSARIPRASKLLIYGLFQKGRVLAQDGVADGTVRSYPVSAKRCFFSLFSIPPPFSPRG